MAIFGKWQEWRAMARDLQVGLSRLTIAENMLSSEFRWKDWDVRVVPYTDDMAPVVNETRGRYLRLGGICFFSFYFNMVLAADGAAVYMNTPLLPSSAEYQAWDLARPTRNGAPYHLRIRDEHVTPGTGHHYVVNFIHFAYSNGIIVVPYGQALRGDFVAGRSYLINGYGFYEVEDGD